MEMRMCKINNDFRAGRGAGTVVSYKWGDFMRDIPVFTTEFGAASLIIKEIPYTQTAYVRIQSSLTPAQLLAECKDFCRAAGAEKVYAAGENIPEEYPLHTQIFRMSVSHRLLHKTDAVAKPVVPEQAAWWKEIYNRAMSAVDNAAYMDDLEMKQMLQLSDGCFVYRGEELIGIGRVTGSCIRAVSSVVRGGGKDSLLALASLIDCDEILLDVASTNERAIRLYEKLGFAQKDVVEKWYKIL